MTYCTLGDIEKQLAEDEIIELADDSGAGEVNAGMIAAAGKAVEDGDTTPSGAPTVDAMEAVLGYGITETGRDAAWKAWEVVSRAIADAEEEMDGYLAVSGKYPLPFETVPNLVRKICVDLAICNLFSRKAGEMPKTRKDNCVKAGNILDRVARGMMVLDVPDPATGGDYGIGVTRSGRDRVFTRGGPGRGPGSLDNY